MVVSEDTRHTGRLLQWLGIQKPQIAFHAYNEASAAERVLALLRQGRDVALVSDAGTPGISDPGYTLVRMAVAESIEVTMVPGPCALVMALVLSGLPSHAFTFRGFPPRADGPRRRFLDADAASPHTLIYYESPHRLGRLVRTALEVFGDRQAAVCVELTKKFERVHRAALSELASAYATQDVRGEVTVVIAGTGARHTRGAGAPATGASPRGDARPGSEEDDLADGAESRRTRCLRLQRRPASGAGDGR